MSKPADNPSLRTETSRIRHLEAARARASVAAFRRPVVAGGDARHAHGQMPHLYADQPELLKRVDG
jgi:hypothetical protein